MKESRGTVISSDSFLPRSRRKNGRGCLVRVILLLLFATLSMLALTAVFAPWAFYMGGKFHVLPYWQGWGKLEGPGGQYMLFVQLWPTSQGRITGGRNVQGTAYLCTPRAGRFTLKLNGAMPTGSGLSTNGENITLGMSNLTWKRAYVNHNPPAVSLHGYWQSSKIVMNDDGSFQRAFNADGTVLYGNWRGPYSQPGSPIILLEATKSDFDKACAARQH